MKLGDLLKVIEPMPDDWEVVVYTDAVSYQGEAHKEIMRFNFIKQIQYSKKSAYRNYAIRVADPLLRLTIFAKEPGADKIRSFA